jgi:hypothetical protein
MTTQPAPDYSAQIIAQCNASIQATLRTIPATASNATKCHAMQACDRAANALMRAAIAEQAHDPDTRSRNMAMYRTNLDRAREIIRAGK